MRKILGFTLAEVLITLGIIGIVAAMTIPALISNHRKNTTVSKLKKIYTVMNQAIIQSELENGEAKDWPSAEFKTGISQYNEVLEWYNTYLSKYIRSVKLEKNPLNQGILIYFSDGTILGINENIRDMAFYIDAKALENGQTGLNKFSFRFSPKSLEGDEINNANNAGKNFEPYTWGWNGTREGLINAANGYGCSKEQNKSFCTKLIQYEGWNIPDDYPIKF